MTRNFVILSGGPGLYEPCDKESHDTSWSNYVDNILLLASKGQFPSRTDEAVWWFVYEPAYVARWADDVKEKRASVSDVKKKGSSSYKDHLQKRAAKYGWNLRWLAAGSDFWSKLKTFRDPISRVWYFGHARDDLWLSLNHTKCVAERPAADALVRRTDIVSQIALRAKFQPGVGAYDPDRSSRFYGCNTATFAADFAKAFGVYSEGAQGKVDFATAHPNGGKVDALRAGCTWKIYNTTGAAL